MKNMIIFNGKYGVGLCDSWRFVVIAGVASGAQNALGADMISLMGADSGGLPGEDDTGLFVQAALARPRAVTRGPTGSAG